MEEWRKLIYPKLDEQYNHYEISSYGRLRNINTNRILQQEVLRSGYCSVRIFAGDKKLHIIIHKAVAYTFLDNPNNYTNINHKDNIRTNNNVNNLEWCTPSYNQYYKYTSGSFDSSRLSHENNHNAKLTREAVLFARANYTKRSKEFGLRALSKKYGVSNATMLSAINNKTWKNL